MSPIAGSLLAAALVCASPVADPPPPAIHPVRGGAFILAAYDGRPVPVDRGDLPSRTSEPAPPCHWFAPSDGHLAMDPDYGVFDLVKNDRNCAGHVLGRSTTTGVYRVIGERIVFSRSAAVDDRPDQTFLGRI